MSEMSVELFAMHSSCCGGVWDLGNRGAEAEVGGMEWNFGYCAGIFGCGVGVQNVYSIPRVSVRDNISLNRFIIYQHICSVEQ
jgi:hypothetical protein